MESRMLMPQDPIRRIRNLPEPISQALENIGIQIIIQLVVMTKSQILCIKGIESAELDTIVGCLENEGCGLSDKPMKLSIKPIPGGIAFGSEIPPESMPQVHAPQNKDIVMAIATNMENGQVELRFPVPLQMVSFRPKRALEIAELLAKKARTLMN